MLYKFKSFDPIENKIYYMRKKGYNNYYANYYYIISNFMF